MNRSNQMKQHLSKKCVCLIYSTDSEGHDKLIVQSKSMTELLQAEGKFESGIKISIAAESGEGEIKATRRKDKLDKELKKELKRQRKKEVRTLITQHFVFTVRLRTIKRNYTKFSATEAPFSIKLHKCGSTPNVWKQKV